MQSWPKVKLSQVIIHFNLVLFNLIWPHFCPYLALPTYIYHYLPIFGLFRLNCPYLGIFAINCPDFTMCAIFTLYVYSTIEIAPLCNILEQLDHYSWRYCISNNWGIQRCHHECSLGVNLVIDNFCYVVSDISPLYTICKQSDHYLWKYCILKIRGIQMLSTNAVWVLI